MQYVVIDSLATTTICQLALSNICNTQVPNNFLSPYLPLSVYHGRAFGMGHPKPLGNIVV